MTVHTAIGVATVATLGWLWWRAEKGPNPVTMILRAVRWLAASWRWRRVTRAAWRDGADLFAALAVFRQRPVSEPCGHCGGKHCAGCTEPARVMSMSVDYQPQHDFAGLPPSLVVPLALMTPGERARELVRQLGAKTWHPYRGLPKRTRIKLTAATVAARYRLPLLVGTFALAGRLP